jgi:integrase/recombinase XerD
MLPNLDDFLLDLQANGFSPGTVYHYERDLRLFERFLIDSGTAFEQVTKQTVARFKANLAARDRRTLEELEGKAEPSGAPARPLKGRSVNRMLSILRSFLRWRIEMELPTPLPPDAVKMVRTERKSPGVAEFDELVKLIEAPERFEEDPRVALRNRAMLELLFATGMRISELCGLNRTQLNREGAIFILGKGKKERFVYLTPRASRHLDAYLATREDERPALFIPYRGARAGTRTARVSTNYLQSKIKEYRERLGINVPTSAHSLRHGFATYLAEEGASPVAIQILLGHESLNTTNRYVHASDRYARESHSRYHPLKEADAAPPPPAGKARKRPAAEPVTSR